MYIHTYIHTYIHEKVHPWLHFQMGWGWQCSQKEVKMPIHESPLHCMYTSNYIYIYIYIYIYRKALRAEPATVPGPLHLGGQLLSGVPAQVRFTAQIMSDTQPGLSRTLSAILQKKQDGMRAIIFYNFSPRSTRQQAAHFRKSGAPVLKCRVSVFGTGTAPQRH